MPKQAKKAPKVEECENTESDQVDSAASVSSDEDEEVAPALDASATESDEDEEEVSAGDDDDATSDEEDQDEKMEADDDSEDDDEEDDDKDEEVEGDDKAEDDSEDDDNDEVDDDEDIPKEKTVPAVEKKKKLPVDKKKGAPKPQQPVNLQEKVKKQLDDMYGTRMGLQMFIRFPGKLPTYEELEVKVKALSPLITKVHKPRQNHARFCLVDFENKEDRDKTLQELTDSSKETQIVASVPRFEQEGYLETIVQKKIQQIEVTRARKTLKKNAKLAAKEGRYTSNIVVYNIPKSASLPQIKELFPDAVDIQIKQAPKKFIGVCTAVVICKSTQNARQNQKRKLVLGGNNLFIRFDKKNKNEPKNEETPTEEADKQTKPVLGKKRLSDGDGDEVVAEKKAKVAKPAQKKQKQQQNGNAKKAAPAAGKKAPVKPPQKKQTQKLNETAEETPEVAAEEKAPAKPPQKKQKQKFNVIAEDTPVVAAEEKTKAKPQQKKQKQKLNGSVEEKPEVAAEVKTKAKPPQKKQKQKLNGSAEEKPEVAVEEKPITKAAQKKQQAQPLKGKAKPGPAKANGNSPQKKGGVAKPKPAGKKPLKAQKAKVAA